MNKRNTTGNGTKVIPILQLAALSFGFGLAYVSHDYGVRVRRELRLSLYALGWSGSWTVAGGR